MTGEVGGFLTSKPIEVTGFFTAIQSLYFDVQERTLTVQTVMGDLDCIELELILTSYLSTPLSVG